MACRLIEGKHVPVPGDFRTDRESDEHKEGSGAQRPRQSACTRLEVLEGDTILFLTHQKAAVQEGV